MSFNSASASKDKGRMLGEFAGLTSCRRTHLANMGSTLTWRWQVHSNEPKPIIWTATAESSLAKIEHGCSPLALDQAVRHW